jgi:hypothetical protein
MGRRAHLPSMQVDRDLAKRRTGAPGLINKAASKQVALPVLSARIDKLSLSRA